MSASMSPAAGSRRSSKNTASNRPSSSSRSRSTTPKRRRAPSSSTFPDGTYRFVDYLEDDLVSNIPVRIELALTVDKDSAHLDFTGTDPQVLAAFNIVTAGKPHALAHDRLRAPLPERRPDHSRERCGDAADSRDGAAGHARQSRCLPAALGLAHHGGGEGARHHDGRARAGDPRARPGGRLGQGMIGVISMPDLNKGGRKINVFQVLIGGSGGRPTATVTTAPTTASRSWQHAGGIIEAEMDLLVHEYRYVPDSGGPGSLPRRARRRHDARGADSEHDRRHARHGAHAASRRGACMAGTAAPRPIRAVNIGAPDERTIPELVRYGSRRSLDACELRWRRLWPIARARRRVQQDVLFGFVSRDQARNIYGLVFVDDSDEVDAADTTPASGKLAAEEANATSIYC